jgi:cytochrome P450
VTVPEVKELCFSALFAAIDTTSSVMGWNLFHVARCKDVQEKLHDELTNAVKEVGDNGKLTAEVFSRERIPYLHAVVRETQRLTPTGSMFVHKQIAKDGVEIHGTPLRKVDMVFLEGYSTGVDPSLVDDPEEFRPERWLPEAVAARKGTPKEIIDHPFFKEPFSQGKPIVGFT